MWERLFGVTTLVIVFGYFIVVLVRHRRHGMKFIMVDFIAISATGFAAAWLAVVPDEQIFWITLMLLLFLSFIMEWRSRSVYYKK